MSLVRRSAPPAPGFRWRSPAPRSRCCGLSADRPARTQHRDRERHPASGRKRRGTAVAAADAAAGPCVLYFAAWWLPKDPKRALAMCRYRASRSFRGPAGGAAGAVDRLEDSGSRDYRPEAMDILSASTSFAGELLERTSSTARVQQMVQHLADAGISPRRHRRVPQRDEPAADLDCRPGPRARKSRRVEPGHREIEDLPVLRQRRRQADLAINLSTGAGLLICVVVALTFVSAFVRPPLGTVVALCWISAMALVFGAIAVVPARNAAGDQVDRRHAPPVRASWRRAEMTPMPAISRRSGIADGLGLVGQGDELLRRRRGRAGSGRPASPPWPARSARGSS